MIANPGSGFRSGTVPPNTHRNWWERDLFPANATGCLRVGVNVKGKRLPLSGLADVLVRLDHVASVIVNADNGIM
jgi:hypothetical protein